MTLLIDILSFVTLGVLIIPGVIEFLLNAFNGFVES